MLDFDNLCAAALDSTPLLLRIAEYKVDGLQNNQIQTLIKEEFDITYKDSNMIKSLKTSPKGFYSYSKILNEKELDLLEQIVSKKIEEGEADK